MTSPDAVPLLDMHAGITPIREAIIAAFEQVLDSGRFILGPMVEAFEMQAAAYLGSGHAVAVNSGTDALVISLRALAIGPGHEVITSPFTFFATAEAISAVGATPVFVDIELDTFNLNPDLAASAITDNTHALLPVHLFGHAADMPALNELAQAHDIRIIEDVAQAMGGEIYGRKVGTASELGAFSFFPSKNLGAFGDGGLIVTDDGDLAACCRMLRSHGAIQKYQNLMLGYNSRLDEIQAAILQIKLKRLDESNAGRRRVAARYSAMLDAVEGVVPPVERPGVEHVYHQYTVRILGGRRDEVRRDLHTQGISTAVYYPMPIHRLPVYDRPAVRLPNAERASLEVLSLPIWPEMGDEVIDRVANSLKTALSR